MTADLVQRLRVDAGDIEECHEQATLGAYYGALMREAADEIERLCRKTDDLETFIRTGATNRPLFVEREGGP